jgi:glycine/D-amino acid oxidase-like deaminating enzyme
MDHSLQTPVWPRSDTSSYRADGASNVSVDLVVIGGGILGLTAALTAARRGLAVRLVEARRIGEGASGLNGGQVIPGLKLDPEALAARFGAHGERVVAFAGSTADTTFEFIAREGLGAAVARRGWIQAAHTDAALALAGERSRQWRARGADVALLDAAEVARLTGAKGYKGGWLDRRAGTVDPLAYTQELARVASEAGVVIVENAKASDLKKEGGLWRVNAGGAEIRAPRVLVATNAYSDGLVPGLARTIVPLQSFQIATAPLTHDEAASILPEGHAVSDSRRILVYFRRTPDGRLALGGRGRMTAPTKPEHWAHLERALRRLYPQLGDVEIERRWFGRLAVTLDHLPHIHEPEPGLVAALGCQGRGVALMTALGPKLADYLIDREPDALPLPLTPIRPIPFHAFRQIGVAAAIGWGRALDALNR